jgi:hypothetical protein
MQARTLDIDAYSKVASCEGFLRRVLRWELRGHAGNQWKREINSRISDLIERQAVERMNGLYIDHGCPFAYLSLNELVEVMFRDLWKPIFREVFGNNRATAADLHRLRQIRNRIAHFRPVSEAQVSMLDTAFAILDGLRAYYGRHKQSHAYIPGAFERAEEQLDSDETALLISQLGASERNELWSEFGKQEAIRAKGLSPGMGVVHHHVFFELYTRGSFSADPVHRFALRFQDSITFLNVGCFSDYVRVFVPLKNDLQNIKKILREFYETADDANTNGTIDSPETTTRKFDLGMHVPVVGEGINSAVGFMF